MIATFRRRALRRANAVGQRVIVAGRVDVENLGAMHIGDDVRIGGAAAPTHLVTGPDGALAIGDGTTIGHGAGIAAHARVNVGRDVRIGPFALLLDTDFHVAGAHDSAGSSAPIEIGDGARIGARAVVLRGARIGAGARVAAGSVVTGDVPAGADVAGVPARPRGARGASHAELPSPERVRQTVAETLGLGAAPDDAHGPDEIGAWDSLGTLTLALAMESRFGVVLGPDDMMRVRCVGDLAALVAERAEEAR